MGSISKRVRFEVFKRDDFTCVYCGRTSLDSPIQCDHVVAVSLGGGNGIDNLVTACAACNLGKSNMPVEGWVISQREQKMRNREIIFAIARYWERVLEVGTSCMTFDPNQELVLLKYLERLSIHQIFDAIDKAGQSFGVADYSDSSPEAREAAFQVNCNHCAAFGDECLRMIRSGEIHHGR
jgi:hypothetical protein